MAAPAHAEFPNTLEEVFQQAGAAAPHLSAKAVSIARGGGGQLCLPSCVLDLASSGVPPAGPEWVAGDDNGGHGPGSSSSEEASLHASLKPWGRAVEKMVRCYGGDPSRLLDCCRCVKVRLVGYEV